MESGAEHVWEEAFQTPEEEEFVVCASVTPHLWYLTSMGGQDSVRTRDSSCSAVALLPLQVYLPFCLLSHSSTCAASQAPQPSQ